MEEGNVYLCNKKKTLGIYTLELQENKKIKSKGISLEACKVDICMQIMDWNGDGEAILEFIPSVAKKTATGVHVYTILNSNNDSLDATDTKELYEDGICDKCQFPLGKRNDKYIEVDRKPKGGIVHFYRSLPWREIYSDSFIALLTKEEQELFKTRDVLVNDKPCGYKEIFPQKIVNHVGHKNAIYNRVYQDSWRCNLCKREIFDIWKINNKKNNFVFISSKSFSIDDTVLFIEHGGSVALAVRNDRWIELLKHKKEIRGISTSPIVVLEEKYVEYPELEEPEKFEW
jgi:hypothetical protein